MPRTASTQNLDKAQQRPSARLRAPTVTESTPVLFRLPTIQHSPGSMEIGPMEPEPMVPGPVEIDEVPVGLETKQQAALPEVAAPKAPPMPVEQTVPAAQAVAEVEAEVERSWWEHWSSGVVLILLIIALITASIIAFSDSGSTDPDLLAEFVNEDGDSLGDLSSIKIPEVQMPTEQASAKVASVELPSDSPVQLESPGQLDEPAAAPASTLGEASGGLVLGDLEFDALPDSSEEAAGGNQETTLVPDAVVLNPQSASNSEAAGNSQPAAVTGLLLPTLSEPPQDATAPKSSVSLSQPVGVPPLPLFSNSAGQAPSESAQPAAGQSPALYDEALTNLPLPAANLAPAPGEQSGSTTGNPVDTKQPAYSSLLTSSSSSTPSFTTASHQTNQQSPEGPAEPAGPSPTDSDSQKSGVQKTGTPESQADAIIRAWQEFNALNRSETSAMNRYVPQQGLPASGGVQSYTLGNSSQPTSSAQ